MSQELRRQDPLPASMGNAATPEIALSEEDRAALRQAVRALEGPSYVGRLAALAGRPIELLGQALPQVASAMISKATQAALTRALRYALRTIPKEGRDPETRAHKALAILSGAMGGALGISAVLVELPISTTIMLGRSRGSPRARARTLRIPRRRWPACRSSPWADIPARQRA